MRGSIQKEARNYVQRVETDNLRKMARNIKALIKLTDKAEEKDELCGCSTCHKKFIYWNEKLVIAGKEFEEERDRMYGK